MAAEMTDDNKERTSLAGLWKYWPKQEEISQGIDHATGGSNSLRVDPIYLMPCLHPTSLSAQAIV